MAATNADMNTRMQVTMEASIIAVAFLQRDSGIPMNADQTEAIRAYFNYVAKNRGFKLGFYEGRGAHTYCPFCNIRFRYLFRATRPTHATTLIPTLPTPPDDWTTRDRRSMLTTQYYIQALTNLWHMAINNFMTQTHKKHLAPPPHSIWPKKIHPQHRMPCAPQ